MIEPYRDRALEPVEKDSYPLLETEVAISIIENPYARELWQRFLLAPEFVETAKRWRDSLGAGINVRSRNIAGFFFERLAVDFLWDGLENEIVVPPQDVLRIFRSLYPERRTIPHAPGGINTGIERVWVPDALILVKGKGGLKLTGVCECSLSDPIRPRWRIKRGGKTVGLPSSEPLPPWEALIRRAFFRAILGRYIMEHHPDFPGRISVNGNMRVLYIAPKGNRLAGRLPNEEVWHVPFTREEFYRVLDGFFADVKNGLSS